MNVLDFKQYKKAAKPISMVTCYDSWSATLIENTSIDCILVGDSVAMTMHGASTTLEANTELMALHTRAVRRGAPKGFIIGDMPFLSFRKGLVPAVECAEKLMQAGSSAVKLEGVAGNIEIISHLVESGIPVMGHIGLTPQSLHQLGGFKVQGKSDDKKAQLLSDALALEKAGCFAVVLECVPAAVGKEISSSLEIPTIGIGAGKDCDGQVLVLQDLLGVNTEFRPKFVRTFLDGKGLIEKALNDYDQSVKSKSFPSEGESYL